MARERPMSDDFRISVVIPVFNGAGYLSEAVNSVLEQIPTPVEVIVVDDGSTDNTSGVAASYGNVICYDRQPHKGISATLNRGIEMSHGNLIAFIDADDVWLSDKLRKQTSVLQSQPETDMVFGHSLFFQSPDMDVEVARKLHIPGNPQPAFMKSAMLIRREAFFKVGLFDPAWQVGDFVDWFAKSMEAGLRVHMLPDVVFRRRVHGRNMTIVERSSQIDFVRILKAALDRRRSAARTRPEKDTKHEPSI